ncbi:MAG TPA: electron transport complex protein RnfA [bacterium]|jgi:electron transport complex protein RnfA|nr:electron transport complex protein RnfA [bacterium]HNT65375.1 electron transport complex protein RnfA [bacterium]HOX86543.1 electron transport complex protein RnfA [bacterium]HPG46569.1 electron transport complex protein RnfA [bacterium]HPM98375.1 electron transport complex protein RnfA [bacterium]
MEFQNLMIIALGAIFINNFIFSRFLGICPYIGVSKQLDSAIGMGMAVVFVMTLASAVTWLVDHYLLSPLPINVFYRLLTLQQPPDLVFLRTIAFILVIAALVQFVEMVVQKISPSLYNALGIYLPLITTNCAILGVAILNVDTQYSFIESIVHGFSAGVGFTLALILMAGIRERLELAEIPKSLQGIPIAFIMAGLMAMAFLGFSGLKIGM